MVTVGKNEEGRPICKPLRPQAYFATYNEAYQALLDFRRNPFDLGSSTTLKDLYERWYKTRIGKVSRFTLARYRTSWDYSSSIQNKRVCEIRISDLRNCIENGVILYAGKERHPENNAKDSIKALYNNLFDYAVACGIIDKTQPDNLRLILDMSESQIVIFHIQMKKSKFCGIVLTRALLLI